MMGTGIGSFLQRYFPRYYPRETSRLALHERGFDFLEYRYLGRWKRREVAWADIDRIDAGRIPTMTIDIAYLDLFLRDGQAIVVDELAKGFHELIAALEERWPEIGTRWTSIYTGPPNTSEHRTIWLRPRETVY